MRLSLVIGFLTLMIMVGVGQADIVVNEVEVAYELDNLFVNADFTAGAGIDNRGQLVWSDGSYAKLMHAGGTQIYRCTTDAIFDDCSDTSSEGLASASFNVLTSNVVADQFQVVLFNLSDTGKTNPIGSIRGALYSSDWNYNEGETAENPSALYGEALIKLTYWDVPGFTWSETLGAATGLTASTTGLSPSNIADYQSDWNSNNAVVRILADEASIPEPMTVALLGLGGMAVWRKRRG